MLVVFQNTIIYNPFMPPDARSMKIEDFSKLCGKISWREERIKSLDGTEIALCIADAKALKPAASSKTVYILYFQGERLFLTDHLLFKLTDRIGNASSLPPRLPDISRVVERVQKSHAAVNITVVGVSYRGFWTSHDRPYEKGIDQDTEAAFRWVSELAASRTEDGQLGDAFAILWGQSVGCGFATNLAARTDETKNLQIQALVLETPFTNTRAMLKALYPQTWLPYQYLWPFLRNHLDSWQNMGLIASKVRRSQSTPNVYVIEGGKDELVPLSHGTELVERCENVGLPVQKQTVRNALHNQVCVRPDGKQAIANAISAALSEFS